MSVQIFKASEAPREVMNISPFRNDDRCEEFQVVIGDLYEEVVAATLDLHGANIAEGAEFENYLFDWDWTEDTVSGKVVGFTCKDKEPFDAAG